MTGRRKDSEDQPTDKHIISGSDKDRRKHREGERDDERRLPLCQLWMNHHTQETYDILLVLDRICPGDVGGNLYRCAGDHWGEVPCPVFETGDIRDGKEDDAIYNASDYGEREVRVIHP